MSEEKEELSGTIMKIFKPKKNQIIFSNAIEYGFQFRTFQKEIISCYGTSFELFEGENVVLTGKTVRKADGKSYFAFSEVKVDFKNLKSNDFFEKIFGKKTFEKIFPRLTKKEIIQILDSKDVNSLAMELCMSSDNKRIKKMFATYERYKNLYQAFETLSKYGLSFKEVQKLCKNTNIEEVEKMIKKNPFKLINSFNFTFNQCDIINAHENGDFLSKARLCAGIVEAIREEYNQGNTYTFHETIMERAKKILNIEGLYENKQLINNKNLQLILNRLIEAKKVIKDEDRYYLSYVFAMEERLRDFCRTVLKEDKNNLQRNEIEEYIRSYEKLKGFELGPEQKEAVVNSLQHRVSIITGGAGTGKTSSLAVIIKYLVEHGYAQEQIALCSPTGKAAQRMMESINGQLKTDLKASTIHVLLGAKGTNIEEFTFNENHKLQHDVIVVDETSMMDLSLAYALIQAIKNSTKVIFLGDIDQLPPVMAGYFLRDIIESNVPCIRLLKIQRQKGDSTIVPLSLAIKSNELTVDSIKPKADFRFKQQSDNFEENISWLVDTYIKYYENSYNKYLEAYQNELGALSESTKVKIREKALDEIMVVTPLRDTKNKNKPTMNAQLISNRIQEKIFKDYKGKEFQKNGYNFKIGSKVIISKNNNDKGLTNGQIGYIKDIDLENRTVEIFSDGNFYTLDDEDLNNLLLAYAITVHKSQGSEWRVTIYCCFKETKMNQRNLVYTAVTRAKKILLIFGDKKTFLTSPTNLGAEKRSRLLN